MMALNLACCPAKPPSSAREIRQVAGNNSYNGEVYPKSSKAAEGFDYW
jgi:hypothetical protein